MQRGLIFSVLFHTLVVLAFAIGLPFANAPRAQRMMEVPVDVANIADFTNPPKGKVTAKARQAKVEQKASTAKPSKPAPKPKAAAPKPKAPPPDKKQIATRMEPDTPPPPKKAPPQKAPEKKAPEKKAQPKKAEPAKPKIAATPTLRPRRVIRKAETPKPKPAEKPKKVVKKAAAPKNDAPSKKAETKAKKPPKKVARKPVKKKQPEKKVAKKKPAKKPPKRVARKAKPKKRQVASRPAKQPRPKRRKGMDDIYSFLKKDKGNRRSQQGRDRDQRRAQRAQERQGARNHNASLPLSISERMAIARQIKPCWRFPVGAKDERTLRVEIRVWMGRDGKPIRHQVLDWGRYARDSFFRAAADAGIRAIYNPRCLPIKLPARKYDTWRVMILDFDPAKVSNGAL